MALKCFITFCGFVSVCPCTRLQFTENVDGANSTKPLLPAGADYLTGF